MTNGTLLDLTPGSFGYDLLLAGPDSFLTIRYDEKIPGSSWTFPVPDLQSAISLRDTGYFPWKVLFQGHGLGARAAYYYRVGHCF